MKLKIGCMTVIIGLVLGVLPARSAVFTFSPRFSASEHYSDNIFSTKNNKKGAFTTLISPGFTFDITGKYSGLSLSYNPQYSMYQQYSGYDMWRQNAIGLFWSQLNQFTRFQLRESYTKTQTSLSTLNNNALNSDQYSQVPGRTNFIDTTVRRGLVPYSTYTTDISLSNQFGPQDTITAGFFYSKLDNQDPTIENSTQYQPTLNLNYWFTPLLGVQTSASLTHGEFSGATNDFNDWHGNLRLIQQVTPVFQWFVGYAHTIMDFSGATSDYQIYSPSVGATWTFAKDTALTLSAGYFVQERDRGKGTSGLTLSGNLGKSWTFERYTVSLHGSSGYSENYFGAGNLGFSRYYQALGNLKYGFTRRLSSTLSASFRRDEYIDLASQRDDNSVMIGAGLNYQVLQWMSVGLNYSYYTIYSTNVLDEYDVNQISFTVNLTPKPFRAVGNL